MCTCMQLILHFPKQDIYNKNIKMKYSLLFLDNTTVLIPDKKAE